MGNGMETPPQEKAVDEMTVAEINAELAERKMVHPDDKFWNDVPEGKLQIFLRGVRAGRITPESLRKEDVSFWNDIKETPDDGSGASKEPGFWSSKEK